MENEIYKSLKTLNHDLTDIVSDYAISPIWNDKMKAELAYFATKYRECLDRETITRIHLDKDEDWTGIRKPYRHNMKIEIIRLFF